MILVTGGAGYIGSHFVRTYLLRNPKDSLVVVDSLVEGHKEAIDSGRVQLFLEDIADVEAMRTIFSRFQISAVVHFAAFCSVAESRRDPAKYFDNNVVKTLSFLKSMQEAGVKKIVFSSSAAVYGNPASPLVDEAHDLSPVNVYGTTKQMVEQILASYAVSLGWSFVALRYFNAAGADDSDGIGESHEPETHLIPLILQTALGKREYVQINGEDYETPDGTCIRDYVHVNDLAQAHCLALEQIQHKQMHDSINLGTAQGSSVKEVIAMCKKVTGKNISVKSSFRREGDPPILVTGCKKAKQVLDWQPRYDLQKIVETAWQWEQNRRF